MKRLLTISLVVLSIFSNAQDLELRTFVKEDTVQLRWFPTSGEVMQSGLKNGYVIVKTVNGSSSEEIIQPWKDRRSRYLNSSDSLVLSIIDFIDEFQSISDFSSSGTKTAFGLLTLSSSAYHIVGEMIGCYTEYIDVKGGADFFVSTGDFKSRVSSVNAKKEDRNQDFTTLDGSSRPDLVEVYLKWEAQELNPYYGGYYIYKSFDGKNFETLNKLPLFHFTSEYEKEKSVIDYVDNDVEEGSTYFYKVVPINHFGDPGIESEVVEVYVQKRLNGICMVDTVLSNELTRTITGFYDSEFPDEISEFVLFRSDSISFGYEQVSKVKSNDEKTFSFDYKTNLTSGDRHYFMVAAVGTDGDSLYSFPYYHFSLDQIPPGVVENLEGAIDSSGIVKLSWTAPPDKDIRGYRVFRTNSLEEEFVEVTQYFAENEGYSDTISLNNLTSSIYYMVRTVDLNYNNGPLCEPVKLMKPDTIPPVPPAFRKYEVKEEGIKLIWTNSPSDDIQDQILLRQLEGYTDTILYVKNDMIEYVDTSCLLGRNYQYRFLAIDESKNVSESQAIAATYEIGYRPAPKGFKGEANREAKSIILNWNQVMDEIYSIQIYRAKNDGKFGLYKTIRDNVDEFVDEDLSINNTYRYKIKVMYKSGISSKMSSEISIVY